MGGEGRSREEETGVKYGGIWRGSCISLWPPTNLTARFKEGVPARPSLGMRVERPEKKKLSFERKRPRQKHRTLVDPPIEVMNTPNPG
jgi:hypothetical protein